MSQNTASVAKDEPFLRTHEVEKINRRASRLIIVIIGVIFLQIGLSIGLTFLAINNVNDSRKLEQKETWQRFLRDRFKTLTAIQSGFAEWSEIAESLKKKGSLSEKEKKDWLSGNADKMDLTAIIIQDKVIVSGGLKHDRLSFLLNDARMRKIYDQYSMKKPKNQQLITINEKDFTLLMVASPICDNSGQVATEGIEIFGLILDNKNLVAVNSFLNAKTRFVEPAAVKQEAKPYLKLEIVDSLDSSKVRFLFVDPNIDLFSLVLYPLGISLGLQLLITLAIIISFKFLMRAITRLYHFITAASNELVKINTEMEKDLEMAKRIQLGILPNVESLELQRYLSIDSRYVALATLGGDLYDLIRIGKNYLGILMADVSGHGVPAALITAMVKVAFHNHSRWKEPPSETCFKVNNEIYKLINDHGYYLTAYYGMLNLENGEFMYSNAGHHPALLIKNGSYEIISLGTTDGLFIGIQENTKYSVGSVHLEKGDRLLLFTDGIIEARNAEGEFYEYNRLYHFISTNREMDVNQFSQSLLDDVKKFSQQPIPNDDQAVMMIEYLGDHKISE